MIALGNLKEASARRAARIAAGLVTEHGEIALMLGQTGEAVVLLHYEPGYREALDDGRLCGRYRAVDDVKEVHPDGITSAICEDMLWSWAELRGVIRHTPTGTEQCCSRCREWQPLSNEFFGTTGSGAKMYLRKQCLTCSHEIRASKRRPRLAA